MILDDNNPTVTSENNLYLDHQLNYHHSEPIIIESCKTIITKNVLTKHFIFIK